MIITRYGFELTGLGVSFYQHWGSLLRVYAPAISQLERMLRLVEALDDPEREE
jgi:hypothetical protein